MREPHAVYGQINGHSLFGVRELAVMASRLRAMTAPCSTAAESADARDKYFFVNAQTAMSTRSDASAAGVSLPSRSDVASVAVFFASSAALAFSVSMVIKLSSPPVTDSGPAIDSS